MIIIIIIIWRPNRATWNKPFLPPNQQCQSTEGKALKAIQYTKYPVKTLTPNYNKLLNVSECKEENAVHKERLSKDNMFFTQNNFKW